MIAKLPAGIGFGHPGRQEHHSIYHGMNWNN
jgi:hypothetical protein